VHRPATERIAEDLRGSLTRLDAAGKRTAEALSHAERVQVRSRGTGFRGLAEGMAQAVGLPRSIRVQVAALGGLVERAALPLRVRASIGRDPLDPHRREEVRECRNSRSLDVTLPAGSRVVGAQRHASRQRYATSTRHRPNAAPGNLLHLRGCADRCAVMGVVLVGCPIGGWSRLVGSGYVR